MKDHLSTTIEYTTSSGLAAEATAAEVNTAAD